MKFTGITPVHSLDDKYVKREDLACWESLEFPSGSKVRQYLAMAAHTVSNEGYAPCIVGCSANSAMSIYVASTAKRLNTGGIIYTAKRKVRSDAIKYAIAMGAEVNEMTPKQGHYLNNLQKHARQRAIDLKEYVAWDRKAALQDTIDQCVNIPENIRRIVVPTGSGLTAAGIILALQRMGRNIDVLVIKSSMMDIKFAAPICFYPGIKIIQPTSPYDTPLVASLPDETPLDPFYAAKAWHYVGKDDLFWPPGLRPVMAMPEVCQKAFKGWKGPQ